MRSTAAGLGLHGLFRYAGADHIVCACKEGNSLRAHWLSSCSAARVCRRMSFSASTFDTCASASSCASDARATATPGRPGVLGADCSPSLRPREAALARERRRASCAGRKHVPAS